MMTLYMISSVTQALLVSMMSEQANKIFPVLNTCMPEGTVGIVLV